MASSLDVARRAGVSQSAVSRVFTPGASASDGMRARVLAAAAALKYRPNIIARSLTTGRTGVIGLVVASLDNQYCPVVVEALCTALQTRGYHLMLFIVPRSGPDVERVVAEVLDHQVDGVVMASVAMSSTLAKRCAEEGVPVVLFNRSQDDPLLSTVTSDDAGGGRTLARFLLTGGHRRIGYVAGAADASTQCDREQGFRDGMAEGRMALWAREEGDFGFASGQEAARRMFGNQRHPDAVFVAGEHMAFAVMDVLRFELGLRIPEDVSVVSYDDAPQAAWPSYSLTAIQQPTGDMVLATVDALLSRIEDQAAPLRQTLPGRLAIRTSARVPEGWS